MANFAAEADVRLRFQFNDTTIVPTELVEVCLDEAHTDLLRALDPVYDVTPVEPALVTGETLLAGARIMRALAAKDAAEQQDLQIGSHRIRPSGRADTLVAMAILVEKDAWYVMEPYLLDVPARTPLTPTPTQPVLGESET